MTTIALHGDDLDSFENFIARYTATKPSPDLLGPPLLTTNDVDDVPDMEVPAGAFLLSTISSVSFHQKVRRAFLETGYFRFDSACRDIEIRQIGNILEIEVNVSSHSRAKEATMTTWEKMRKRIVDVDWEADDLYEVNYIENKQTVHILFISDKLLKGVCFV